MPDALLANLKIKKTDEIVYPNTVAGNVAMGDGTTLTDFHSDMKSFKTTQEQTNSTLNTWKDGTEKWKSTHTHTMSQITDLNLGNMTVGTASKVANDLVISINGGTTENDDQFTYNGSRRIVIDLDPDRLGAATYDHVHEANQIEGLDEAIADKISMIAPSGHKHDMSDINGLTEYITNAIDETDYDTTVPTTVSIGGLAAGYTPPTGGIKVADLLYTILHPYVAPSVSVRMSPTNGSTVEWNTPQHVSSAIVTVKQGSNPLTKIEVYNGSDLLTTSETVSPGTNTISLDLDITKDSAAKNITVRLYDDTNKYVSATSGSFTFVYPYYYGVSADIPTADSVAAMTKKVAGKGNQTISYTMTQQRAIFACYKGNGAISQILDTNGFDATGTFTRIEGQIDGLDYYIYYNSPSTNTAFKFNFKY